MSALGQKQTLRRPIAMSALPPKADIRQHGLGCPLCANNGLVHRCKQHPHSITSSAIAGNLSEKQAERDFAV
jgi:hypothetical protein